MKDIACKTVSTVVYGAWVLLAVSGWHLFGYDMSVIMPFSLIAVSWFGLYCTLVCNKSCKKACAKSGDITK
jgi:hypothetical protein